MACNGAGVYRSPWRRDCSVFTTRRWRLVWSDIAGWASLSSMQGYLSFRVTGHPAPRMSASLRTSPPRTSAFLVVGPRVIGLLFTVTVGVITVRVRSTDTARLAYPLLLFSLLILHFLVVVSLL